MAMQNLFAKYLWIKLPEEMKDKFYQFVEVCPSTHSCSAEWLLAGNKKFIKKNTKKQNADLRAE